jgi:hypothetical protein
LMLENIVGRLDIHLPIWLSSRPWRPFVLSVASLFVCDAAASLPVVAAPIAPAFGNDA